MYTLEVCIFKLWTQEILHDQVNLVKNPRWSTLANIVMIVMPSCTWMTTNSIL